MMNSVFAFGFFGSLYTGNVFQNLEKGAVLQEKTVFNESPVNPRKCRVVLTKFLYMIHQGETFTKQEATDLFFAVTKLFQSQDVCLFVFFPF